jgi:site-specific recombinase XerD
MQLKELFNDYLAYLANNGMDAKTIREHKRFLEGAIAQSVGNKEIENLRIIDSAAVRKAAEVHGEYGPQRAVVAFRQLMKYAKAAGLKVPFDWRDVEVPKVPKKENEYLTIEEIDKIRNAIDTTKNAGIRTRTLIEVLLDTGMRISEACFLKKEDIDWELKEAHIVNVKTKDHEKVYFTDRSLEWLKRYFAFRTDDLPWAFVSGRGHLLPVTSRNYIRTHLLNLGIKKHLKHHLFRKSFVTHLIQGGADITAVGDLARHRSPRTTLRHYAAVNKERSKDVHRRVLDRVFNGAITADEYIGTKRRKPKQGTDAAEVRREDDHRVL